MMPPQPPRPTDGLWFLNSKSKRQLVAQLAQARSCLGPFSSIRSRSQERRNQQPTRAAPRSRSRKAGSRARHSGTHGRWDQRRTTTNGCRLINRRPRVGRSNRPQEQSQAVRSLRVPTDCAAPPRLTSTAMNSRRLTWSRISSVSTRPWRPRPRQQVPSWKVLPR
jgi:hypothetical protein